MEISPVFRKQFTAITDRILHVPGNYNSQRILEMTVVVDTALERETVTAVLPALLKILKTHDRVFQNVRFNLTFWEPEGNVNRVCPMMMAMTEGLYQDYVRRIETKSLEELTEYLRVFHARSKLILLLTDGSYQIEDIKLVQQHMRPFLEKKLMRVCCEGTAEQPELSVSYREWQREEMNENGYL